MSNLPEKSSHEDSTSNGFRWRMIPAAIIGGLGLIYLVMAILILAAMAANLAGFPLYTSSPSFSDPESWIWIVGLFTAAVHLLAAKQIVDGKWIRSIVIITATHVVTAFISPSERDIDPYKMPPSPGESEIRLEDVRRLMVGQGNRLPISRATITELSNSTSRQMLFDLMTDSDARVRTAVVNTLPLLDKPSNVVPLLITGLKDSDESVQFACIFQLGKYGTRAPSAKQELARVASDGSQELRNAAIHSLWEVDHQLARQTAGWKEYAFPKWGFSVEFPAKPKERVKERQNPFGKVTTNVFEVTSDFAIYTLALHEYPQGVLTESFIKEHLEQFAIRVEKSNLSVTRQTPITQFGRSGYAITMKGPDRLTLRNHYFYVGDRIYQIQLGTNAGRVNAQEIEYFLKSLRID